MTNHSLVCPFLTEEPSFAYGVEFGMLRERMRRQKVIQDFFSIENQDRILLLASRTGWKVRKCKRHDKFWFWCELRKKPQRRTSYAEEN